MRLKNSSKRRFVGPVACVMALGFLGFSVVYPQIGSVYAAESMNPVEESGNGTIQVEVQEVFGPGVTDTEGSANGQISVDVENVSDQGNVTATESKSINVTVEEFLQITIPKAEDGTAGTADVVMEADPVSGGVTTRNSSNFTVAGNNRNGFGVFVYADTDPALNSANTSVKVAPITGNGTALSDFDVNKWGYNVTKANATETTINSYNPLAVRTNTTTAAYTVDHPSAGEDLKLNCGAKVDTSIPAGTYSTGVVISAVAPATNWQP